MLLPAWADPGYAGSTAGEIATGPGAFRWFSAEGYGGSEASRSTGAPRHR